MKTARGPGLFLSRFIGMEIAALSSHRVGHDAAANAAIPGVGRDE